jgi:hypothetical protein
MESSGKGMLHDLEHYHHTEYNMLIECDWDLHSGWRAHWMSLLDLGNGMLTLETERFTGPRQVEFHRVMHIDHSSGRSD